MFSDRELEAIREEWTLNPDWDELPEPNSRFHLSLDLSEATYNIPFDVLLTQHDVIDELLEDFEPWEVFKDLFKVFEREVDMTDLIEKKYWSGPDTVISSNGTFMGDPLSFMHLSLYLRGSVFAVTAEGHNPIGQSVGDDLVLLGISRQTADRFNAHIVRTGGVASKFNASSQHAITFCENFAYTPKDRGRHVDYAPDSVFGDMYFLDIIKGSLLSGKTKVSALGSDPFLGHSRMLNKQLEYHPVGWVKKRAPVLLWATNYYACRGLQSALASVPEALGGINLSVGTKRSWPEPGRGDFVPYLVRILEANDIGFFTFATLLRGVYKANPKGVPYENSLETLERVFGTLKVERQVRQETLLPDYMRHRPMSQRLSYIGRVLNMVSLSHLVGELARREAFSKLWDGQIDQPYMTLPLRRVKERHKQVWREIRNSFEPASAASCSRFSSWEQLGKAYDDRLWNVYFNKEDVSLTETFGGMPSLFITYK